jgi:diguanylate cyclase (GGDEF)-like protein
MLGLVLAQAITVLTLALVVGRASQQAQEAHQNVLLKAAAAEAAERLRVHVEPAESVAASIATLVSGEIADPGQLVDLFRESMERHPQIDGLYIGQPNGEFTYLMRQTDGYRLKQILVDEESRSVTLLDMDGDGTVLGVTSDPDDGYDPTTRPWYRQASSTPGHVVWTEPYVFFTSGQVGVTAARRIDRGDDLVGVVGADLELGSLSAFLPELTGDSDGGTVIVNESGTVVAHADQHLLQQRIDGEVRTVDVVELDDSQAQAAIGALVPLGLSSTPLVTEYETAEYGVSRAASRSVPVGSGFWSVYVYGPENTLVGDLSAARTSERRLLVAAGAFTVLLVAVAALPATRSIVDLENRATNDPLTGLPNRRTIMRRADQTAHMKVDVTLAILDIDFFKQVNDTYGHQVGDVVLQAVSQRIQSQLRAGASIGRIGGEEFLLVLPETGLQGATAVCDRILSTLRSSAVTTQFEKVEVTASIGAAVALAPSSRDALMSVADEALRAAKEAGRDRAIVETVDAAPRSRARALLPARFELMAGAARSGADGHNP